jgi:hypothetical protein
MESKLLLETDTVALDEAKEEEVGILQFLDQLEEIAKHYFSRYLKKLFNCHIGTLLKVLKNENLNHSELHDFFHHKAFLGRGLRGWNINLLF